MTERPLSVTLLGNGGGDRLALALPLVLAITLFTACARPAPTAPPAGDAVGSPASPPARKTLTIAYIQEPPNIEGFSGEAGRGGSGPVKYMVHDYLVHEDDRPAWEAHLAVEPPVRRQVDVQPHAISRASQGSGAPWFRAK